MKTGELKRGFVYETEEKITESGFENSSTKIIPKDSVVVAMYGDGDTAGSVAINRIDLTTNQACCNLVIDPSKADHRYVYYYLKGSYENLVALKLGGSQQNLNAATIRGFSIRKPGVEGQRKIAAILTAFDDLIEANQRRIALLERMAEEIYREWFVRLRFPSHENTKFTKGVPAGWERTKIGNLTAYLKRGVAPSYDDTAPGIAINQKCIRDGRVDLAFARRQSRDVSPERQVKFGDVLVNSTGEGTLGRVAQVLTPISNCIVDSHVTIARPRANVTPHFFGMTMKSWEVHLVSMGRGATNQTELAPSVIGGIEVVLPPKEIQERFESLVGPLFAQAANLAEQIIRLTRTRDLLLPRLISGKLRVDDLAIQFPPSMAAVEPS
jgi:type I restriction enzyme S subunit